MSITTITKEDFEADDILATLATRGAARGFPTCSSSRATATRSSSSTTTSPCSTRTRRASPQLKRYDRDAVIERYGIEPEQYPDIAALVGETSDNLIGIDKVGEKTAVKWIGQYGSLDGILEHADEIKGVVGEQPARAEGSCDPQPHAQPPADRRRTARRPARTRASADGRARPCARSSTACEFRTLLERVLKIAAGARTATAPPTAAAPGDRRFRSSAR